MSQVKVQGNPSGTGIFTIASPNSNSNYTLTLPTETGTVLSTATPGVPVNGPAFNAYAGSTTSVSNATTTVIAYSVEAFDVGGCYNNTGSTVTLNGISVPAYSFAPNVAGYYFVSGSVNSNNAPGNTNTLVVLRNGTNVQYGSTVPATGSIGSWTVSSLVYLNGTSDYVSIALYQNSGSTLTTNNDGANRFCAAMVRAA